MIEQPHKRIAVLHVDDDVSQRAAVGNRLRSDARFLLIEPASIAQLDRLLAERSFDAVLTELAPWGTGPLELLEKVAAVRPQVPVVVVTSHGSEHWAVEAMTRGAVDYLPATAACLDQFPERLANTVSKHARNQRLREHQDLLVAHSPGLMCVVGFDGFMKHWNSAWAMVVGYTAEEMTRLTSDDLVHPEDRGAADALREHMYAGKSITASEIRIRCKDGSHKWILWNAVSSVEQQLFFATGVDISERKAMEARLQESEHRFQLIATATGEAVWDWDLRENRLWWSETYRETFGEPADPNRTIEWWYNSLHPEDRERVMSAMPPPLVNGKQQWTLEYRRARLDGSYAQIYDRGFVVFDDVGQPVRMVGSAMDVSELKDTAQRLRESEERFRLAALATRDAIWDWDLNKGEIWRSEGFQTLFGYAVHECDCTLSWWLDRVHDDDRPKVLAQIPAPGASQPSQCTLEYRFRRADGTYADVVDRGFIMYSPEGKPVRMIGTISDISDRRRAEENAHLQHAELAHMARVSTIGEMATGLAHELNQPLTAIANYAESCARALANGRAESREKLGEWIEKIATNTHRAGEIIRRLRGFTKKSPPRRSQVAVQELVDETIELLEAETRLQKVRVQCDPLPNLQLTVDPVQIQQVLVNLLRNAYEAMEQTSPDQRRVAIRAQALKRQIEIAVQDQGVGILPDDTERVFDAFFTSKPHGVGIGLAISRSIIENHGGRLWVTPNAQRGVTFRFTLPLNGT